MSDDIFEKITAYCTLGRLAAEPLRLSGGLMHKMYSLITTEKRYAVKLLNPCVMKRETAQENFRNAELLEAVLEKQKLPILPALVFHGKKMQEIDGQYFYVFNWFEGKTAAGTETTTYQCAEIGKSLARIHTLHNIDIPSRYNEVTIEWDFYIRKMKTEHRDLYKLLYENRDSLYDCQRKRNKAVKKLPGVLSICHNDMDTKNVLWNDRDYRIIDLECLSYASPFLELYETALCWSGFEKCNIDFTLFKTVIQSYADEDGILPEDWETIHDSNYSRLEWLEYNIKRALGIDSGLDEKDTSITETRNTIALMAYYSQIKEAILHNLP